MRKKDTNIRKCNNFRDRIDSCCLMDLGNQGHKFSWKGPCTRGYMRVFEHLDRAVCNNNWRTMHGEAIITTLTRIDFSNHDPILLRLETMMEDKGIGLFILRRFGSLILALKSLSRTLGETKDRSRRLLKCDPRT